MTRRNSRNIWFCSLVTAAALAASLSLGACGEESPEITYEPELDISSFVTDEPFGSLVTYEPNEGLRNPESSEPSGD